MVRVSFLERASAFPVYARTRKSLIGNHRFARKQYTGPDLPQFGPGSFWDLLRTVPNDSGLLC
jgi:hypothetical protein